jgi:pyruvate dehydrogenase E2 component (dihydrolipoamide acetyltransferase)
MAASDDRDGRTLATPLARLVAGELGVELAAVAGSGRGGRVMRADVEAFAAAEVAGEEGLIPVFHLTTKVDAERLMGLRAELDVSVDDLVVKACAMLLAANPELNVSWGGDRLLAHKRVHVGIAVAVDGGLLVPVLHDADRKSITQVAREARELIGRARAGELAAGERTGGTFTVSNLGMFGIDQFMAVVNPPEAAVLAVGAALDEPVIGDDGEVAVRRRMRLTLSIDHRALDGAAGARFLEQLKGLLEQPLRIVS